MKYLKYGFYSIVTKPVFNIIIMLELAAILVVGNLTIAAANSRAVLYEPYADYIRKEGYVFTPNSSLASEGTKVNDVYASLEGDISIHYTYYDSLIGDEGGVLQTDPIYNTSTYRNMYCFEKDVFSKFNLPLQGGRWASCERDENGRIETVAVIGDETYLKIGDIIKGKILTGIDEDGNSIYKDIGEVIIVGIIEKNNYFPTEGFHHIHGGINEINITNIYNIQEDYIHHSVTFLVCAEADEALHNPVNIRSSTAFITYESEPDSATIAANEEKLSSIKNTTIKMSEFRERTNEYLQEQYVKLLPILLCVFIIVIAELVCSVAMNTKTQMKNYGIYFLCGCRWKDCLKISVAYSAIILFGGAVIGSAAFVIFQLSDYSTLFEQNMAVNNIYITAAIIAVMLVVSLIVPFFMVRRTSPVETIHSN